MPDRPPTAAEIADRIDWWHRAPCGRELHEALGWTWDEYAAWVGDRSAVPARPLPEV